MLLDDLSGGWVASLPQELIISGMIVTNVGKNGELHPSRKGQCSHHAHNWLSLKGSAL